MCSDGRTSRGSLQERAARLKAETEARHRQNAEQPTIVNGGGGSPPSTGYTNTSPTGIGEFLVQAGDCISSIAKNTGHFWETIWNEAGNEMLREARKDPNVLLPGDRVHVPPLRRKYEPGNTEMRHRFVRHGEPAVLRLKVAVDDEPLANEKYAIEIDGEFYEGTTDAEGKFACPIPANAKKGRLLVGEDRMECELNLGHIDPVEHSRGVQQRLVNLGYDCSNTDGEWDEACKEAMRQFQKSHGLAETSEQDESSRAKLKELHGS